MDGSQFLDEAADVRRGKSQAFEGFHIREYECRFRESNPA